MKLLKILVIVFIISVAFITCQKEISADDIFNPPLQNTVGDSVFLDKIYNLNISGGGADTSIIRTYYYDNLKRVTAIEDSSLDVGDPLKPFFSLKYFYSGTDTLPFKSLFLDYEKSVSLNNPFLTDTVITFFRYDAVGRNQSDSASSFMHDGFGTSSDPFVSNRYKIIQNYQYAYGKIFRKVLTTNVFGVYYGYVPLGEQRDTATVDANGNILTMKRYSVNSGVSVLEFNSQYTYDNKVNPYCRLSDFRTYSVVPHFKELSDLFQTKNNRLNAMETDINGNIEKQDLTGQYTYRNDGYPLILILDYPQVGETQKIIYTYKSL